MNDEKLKSLWKSQPIMTGDYSFEQLQRDATVFRRKTVRGNILGSIAALAVASIFGFYAWILPVLSIRIGSGLVMLGSFFVLYQLQYRASIRKLPTMSLALPYTTYFRAELVRQRDALRDIWGWLIPSALGMGLFFWGVAQPNPTEFPWWITSVVFIPFAAAAVMHFLAAHRLQSEIDQLDKFPNSAKH